MERTGALLVAWTPEQRRPCPPSRRTPGGTGTWPCGRCGADELYAPASRGWDRARSGRSRSRTRASSVPGPRRSPSRPRRSARASGSCSARPVTGVGSGRRLSIELDDDARAAAVPVGGQRGRAGQRRGRPDVRRRRVHHPAAAGRAHRVRQAGQDADPSILLPVPTARTKGVLVAPTVYGNVLLGPTAEDVADRCDTATTAAGLGSLLVAGRRILPGLAAEEITSTYAGLRAATEHPDYLIRVDARAAVRVRWRHPLHRPVRLAGHRGARRRGAGRGGAAVAAPAGRDAAAADAVHRRGGAAAVPGRGGDRGRPGVRPDRLPLRAGQPGRDQGRPGQPGTARRPGRAAAADPGHERALPGLLLRGRGVPAAAADVPA